MQGDRMHISRKTFVLKTGSVFSTLGIVRSRAAGAEFTFKLSLPLPANQFTTIRALAAAQKSNQESDGRLEIQVFPSNALGNSGQVFSQVRLGAVQMILAADQIISAAVPVAGMTTIPFAFSDQKSLLS